MNQDLELVKLSKTNPEYFGLIYDKYFERIYRFFLSRLGNVASSEVRNNSVSTTSSQISNAVLKILLRM